MTLKPLFFLASASSLSLLFERQSIPLVEVGTDVMLVNAFCCMACAASLFYVLVGEEGVV